MRRPAGGRQQVERGRPAPRLRGALIQKRSIRQSLVLSTEPQTILGAEPVTLDCPRPTGGDASSGLMSWRRQMRWSQGSLSWFPDRDRLGHSVAMLLRVYASCIDGGDAGMNDRIGGALG